MKAKGEAGLTLIEIVFAIALMAIAMVGLVSVIIHTTRHNAVMRENMIAMRAAERQLEVLQSTTFDTIFTQFGTAPANTFLVDGLVPVAANARVGAIWFPTENVASRPPGTFQAPGGVQLLETAARTLIGMDVDMNGNGSIDTTNILGQASPWNTYGVLPVSIELNWRGIQGTRQLVYRHVILKK